MALALEILRSSSKLTRTWPLPHTIPGPKIWESSGLEISDSAINASFRPTLDELLAVADCVVLETPFGGSKLITRETLAKFKQGVKFVNIARGTLVDEAALVDALKSGQLSAAGLGVHENEPNVHKDLTSMRNVTLVSPRFNPHL